MAIEHFWWTFNSLLDSKRHKKNATELCLRNESFIIWLFLIRFDAKHKKQKQRPNPNYKTQAPKVRCDKNSTLKTTKKWFTSNFMLFFSFALTLFVSSIQLNLLCMRQRNILKIDLTIKCKTEKTEKTTTVEDFERSVKCGKSNKFLSTIWFFFRFRL